MTFQDIVNEREATIRRESGVWFEGKRLGYIDGFNPDMRLGQIIIIDNEHYVIESIEHQAGNDFVSCRVEVALANSA